MSSLKVKMYAGLLWLINIFVGYATDNLVYMTFVSAITPIPIFYIFYLRGQIDHINHRLEVVSTQAHTDQLTGVKNRHAINAALAGITGNKRRTQDDGLPYTFMMIDIDHFKRINDMHGHHHGDLVLSTFAGILSNNFRSSDIVGRWGGEEFAVICPNTDGCRGIFLANKIRKAVEQFPFEHGEQVTISVGLFSVYAGDSFDDAMVKADTALYHSKRTGRNRATLYNTTLDN